MEIVMNILSLFFVSFVYLEIVMAFDLVFVSAKVAGLNRTVLSRGERFHILQTLKLN